MATYEVTFTEIVTADSEEEAVLEAVQYIRRGPERAEVRRVFNIIWDEGEPKRAS